MSGYTEDAALNRQVLLPGEAFLAKPFTPDALARKVAEVLEGVERSGEDSGAVAPNDAYQSPSRSPRRLPHR